MSDPIIGERLQGIPEFISLEPKSKPVFFCACPTKVRHIEAALREIRLRCGNPEIEKIHQSKCNAAFYVPCPDFRLTTPIVEQILFFFRRDGGEAQVFEWNWVETRFFARRELYFTNARRII